MNAGVLVVDDEPAFRMLAQEALAADGFEVRLAANIRKARQELEAFSPDVIILDRRLPDGDGIDFLTSLQSEGAGAPAVLVVTAYGDINNAVAALRAGAADYLTKPIQLTDLLIKLRKVLEARGLRDRLALARTPAPAGGAGAPQSPAMQQVIERLRSVAISPLTPVFLMGPSGAGKQHAAEMLHRLTYQATDQDAPFVEVNCAAIPDELLESELFGHEKGAFTDAKGTRRGLIEMASGGTLFLDEITELELHSQAKLLKFIDSMRVRRVGGHREIAVELRVVAASNRDVMDEVAKGNFREDLWHRLSVFAVNIPPLSARSEDIPALAAAFVTFFSARVKRPPVTLSRDAVNALMAYDYPGNVRELRNIMERAVILCRTQEITAADLMLAPKGPRTAPASDSFFSIHPDAGQPPPSLDVLEQKYVRAVLGFFNGQRMQAAKSLGISYPTFLKILRESDGAGV